MSDGFDVFLSHSSTDKPVVRQLADELQARGLSVWLDERELIPGQPWQEALEEGIQSSRAVAVLLGPGGQGPWQKEEMNAALQLAVARSLPVIPVLLPGTPADPKLPLFLRGRTWVDLRQGLSPASLDHLAWSIRGAKSERRDRVGSTSSASESQRSLGWIGPGTFNRLVLLFTETKSAWAMGVFSTDADRDALIDSLARRIAPAPVKVVAFSPSGSPDPLAHLQGISSTQGQPAPVVCFSGVAFAIPDLAQHLDHQRERLARLPHRILLWVSEQERLWLLSNAPNFCSRLSGTFDFRRPEPAEHRAAPVLPVLIRTHDDLLPRSRPRPRISADAALDRARRLLAEIEGGTATDLAAAYFEIGGLLELAPRNQERVAEIHEAYTRSAAAARSAGQPLRAAEATWRAASVAGFDPRLSAGARERVEEAERLFAEIVEQGGPDGLKAEIGLAASWTSLAGCDLLDGFFPAALEKLDRAARLYYRRGAFAGQALALRTAGAVATLQQDWPLAEAALRRSLEISQHLQRNDLVAPALQLLGDALSRQGRGDGAPLLDRGLALAKEANDPLTAGYALLSLGHLRLRDGEQGPAEAAYLEALDVLRRVAFEPAVANALMSLANLLEASDRDAEAETAKQEAEEIYRRWGLDRVFAAAGVTS